MTVLLLCLCSPEADEPAGVKINEEPQEEAAELHQDKLWLKACSCYIRTRCNDHLVFSCQGSDRHKNPLDIISDVQYVPHQLGSVIFSQFSFFTLLCIRLIISHSYDLLP